MDPRPAEAVDREADPTPPARQRVSPFEQALATVCGGALAAGLGYAIAMSATKSGGLAAVAGVLCAVPGAWLASARRARWRRRRYLREAVFDRGGRVSIEDDCMRLRIPTRAEVAAPDAMDDRLIQRIAAARDAGLDVEGPRLRIPLADEAFNRQRIDRAVERWLDLAEALAPYEHPEQAWLAARLLDPTCPTYWLFESVARLKALGADALIDRVRLRLRATTGADRPLTMARVFGDTQIGHALLDDAGAANAAPDTTDVELFELVEMLWAADHDPAHLEHWSHHPWAGVRLAALRIEPDALADGRRRALMGDPDPRVAAFARDQILDRVSPAEALAIARSAADAGLPLPEDAGWQLVDAATRVIDLLGREGQLEDAERLKPLLARPQLAPAARRAHGQLAERFGLPGGVLSLVEADGRQGGLSAIDAGAAPGRSTPTPEPPARG